VNRAIKLLESNRIGKTLNNSFTSTRGVLDENNIITYEKGVSLLTCPYFLAYHIYVSKKVDEGYDSDIINVNTFPYIGVGSIINDIRNHPEERYKSLKNTNASIVYSYFNNCHKLITIDKSCESPCIVNGYLLDIIQNRNNKLYAKLRRQLKGLRDHAITTGFRGGSTNRVQW
jgi:hypothetical protein